MTVKSVQRILRMVDFIQAGYSGGFIVSVSILIFIHPVTFIQNILIFTMASLDLQRIY